MESGQEERAIEELLAMIKFNFTLKEEDF